MEKLRHYIEEVSEQNARKSITRFVNSIVPMSDPDMELCFRILQYREIKKNGFLLKEGEVCCNFYFLLSGFLRMFYVDENGCEINYSFSDKNNFFVDFQSHLLQRPSQFYWQAMQDSVFFVLPYQEKQALYASSPAWNNFGRLVAERACLQMNERVKMLLLMTPEERYVYLLDTTPELFMQVSQFHLSSYLGVTPESLSRLKKRLLKR